MPGTDVLSELKWRGLVHQCTDEPALDAHLSSGARSVYAGFDPTSTSLTIGNLVPIMILAHLKRAGHRVVVVMGGGTGLIGDPSGKAAERQLLTDDRVNRHIAGQRPIFDAVLGQVDGPEHTVINNAEWLRDLGYIRVLRDVGKHFRVNEMVKRDSVRDRLEREQGLSYTEFSYMILQAYDFLHLYHQLGVTVQVGGSDQFGNIISGADLIRRWRALRTVEATEDVVRIGQADGKVPLDAVPMDVADALRSGQLDPPADVDVQGQARKMIPVLEGLISHWRSGRAPVPEAVIVYFAEHLAGLRAAAQGDAYGLTNPLVTKADGTKFGKTESGAIWLTAEMTSPYAYHQFWLNTADADVGRFLRFFTFLTEREIVEIEAAHAEAPGRRVAQRTLAHEATTLLHGIAATETAEAAGKALFSGDLAGLDEATLREVFAGVPSSDHPHAELEGGVDPVELLVATGLAASKKKAREFVAAGSISVNGRKLADGESITPEDLLHGSIVAIRRGKKAWHLTRWG
jgi:tyrosyl-tRNA synthetase